jgi:hypothetical protein
MRKHTAFDYTPSTVWAQHTGDVHGVNVKRSIFGFLDSIHICTIASKLVKLLAWWLKMILPDNVNL